LNRVGLTASIVEREPLRYTPAGIPVVGLKLAHQSVQQEAGAPRSVALEISAIAVDRVALRIDRIALGTELRLDGFLAARRKHAKALVLHVTEFELNEITRKD